MRTLFNLKNLISLLILLILAPVQLDAQSPPNAYMHRPLFCLDELGEVQAALASDDTTLAHQAFNTAEPTCSEEYETLSAHLEDLEVAAHLLEQELLLADLAVVLGYCQTGDRLIERLLLEQQVPETASNETVQLLQRAALCQTGLVILFPDSSDITLSGTTLGTVPAGLMDSSCMGNLPAEPTVEFNIPEEMTLSIQASAPVGGDLVLAISGPNGVLCNDDYDGLNPGIYDLLAPGSYQAYVGEYSTGGSGTAYTLLFTTDTQAVFSSNSNPTWSTFNPAYNGNEQLYGETHPNTTVEQLFEVEECSGWINNTHDFALVLEEESEIFFRLDSLYPIDNLGLIIGSADEVTCHPDSPGDEADFSGTLGAGNYLIWISSQTAINQLNQDSSFQYNLSVSPYDFNLTVGADPQYGEISLNSDEQLDTSLSGEIDMFYSASNFFGESCFGQVGINPSHQLNIERGQGIQIVSAPNETGIHDVTDMVMVVTGPDDFLYCNDDYEGLNPGFSGWLNPGEYHIFVGPLYQEPLEEPGYTTHFLSIPMTTPIIFDDTLVGREGHLEFAGLSSQVFNGISGGSLSAQSMGEDCYGYIDENAPNYTLEVTDNFEGRIEVMSPGDTTLVLSGPMGTLCNDDSRGVSPIIYESLVPGRYGVWVGSYSEGLEHIYMITFEEAFTDYLY